MAKPEILGANGKSLNPGRPACVLHMPQVIDSNVLYDSTGKYMVGIQAKTLFCPNCGYLVELDHELLQKGEVQAKTR